MKPMAKKEIKIKLAAQFLKDDYENSQIIMDSELTVLKRFKDWLLEKLSDEYYGKVMSDGSFKDDHERI